MRGTFGKIPNSLVTCLLLGMLIMTFDLYTLGATSVAASTSSPFQSVETTLGGLTFLSTRGIQIMDENGNVIILRGVNFSGYEYGAFGYHKESDYAQIASWGFNVVRLPIAWNFIEPRPNWYDDDYLETTVDQDLMWAEKYSIYVIIDMHQYRWSSYFTFDGSDAAGVPDWAVSSYPNSATGQGQAVVDFWKGLGPNGSLASATNPSMQDRFVAMWQHVVQRYSSLKVVAGYDLLNEPFLYLTKYSQYGPFDELTFASKVLPSFYAKVADGIRAVDPTHILFWEPSTTTSLNRPNTVYAPHYPGGGVWGYSGKSGLTVAVEHLVRLAQTWNTPVFIGEWGIVSDAKQAAQYIEYSLDLFDKYMMGSAWWSYGRSTFKMILFDASGKPRQLLVNNLVRPFVRQVSSATKLAATFNRNDQLLQIEGATSPVQILISVAEGYSVKNIKANTEESIDWQLFATQRTLQLSLPITVSQVIVQYLGHA